MNYSSETAAECKDYVWKSEELVISGKLHKNK